jgi:hypothetical protein
VIVGATNAPVLTTAELRVDVETPLDQLDLTDRRRLTEPAPRNTDQGIYRSVLRRGDDAAS